MPNTWVEATDRLTDAAFRMAYRVLIIEPTEAGANAAQIAAGRERFDQIAAEYLDRCLGVGWAPQVTAMLVEVLDRDWARARAGDATPPPCLSARIARRSRRRWARGVELGRPARTPIPGKRRAARRR